MKVSPELFHALRRWKTSLRFLATIPKPPCDEAGRRRRWRAHSIEADCLVRVMVLLADEDALDVRTKAPRRKRRLEAA